MATAPPESVKSEEDTLRLAAELVAAYLANHTVSASTIPELIRTVHATVAGLGQAETEPTPRIAERPKPAVAVSRSVQHDHIICLEDGKKLTMLKRYLRSRYDMSPEDYRRRWGLPPDYPMVAPAYAARRSDFAKQIGLGKGVRRKR
jgi:predicted transcriptional regulator